MRYSAQFELEVITPFFPGGFNKTGRNEESTSVRLSPSLFKGMIRWWFRAACATDDLVELARLEGNVFGNTDKASHVRLSLSHPPIQGEQWETIEGKKGINYLNFWSDLRTEQGVHMARKYIKKCFSFSLRLESNDHDSFRTGLLSLWLALHLGGFGFRSRRGFGNLQVSYLTDNSRGILEELDKVGISFIPKKAEVQGDSYFKSLATGVHSITSILQCSGGSGTTKYSNLRGATLMYSQDPRNNSFEALDKIGTLLSEFRRTDPDAKEDGNIVKWRNRSRFSELNKPVFGLPIRFKFGKSNAAELMAAEDADTGRGNRFGSPMWLSVHKVNGRFYPAVLFLFSNPASQPGVLKIKLNDIVADYNNGNKILEGFAKTLTANNFGTLSLNK